MNDEELKKYFESANEYVKDLKEHPENRMKSIYLNDEVVFLKIDEQDSNLWNFGYAQVLSIEDKNGAQKNYCKTKNIKEVLLKSPSYPFHLYVETQHILKNYTDEKRVKDSKTGVAE